jgi:signal transduction histidine kinase
MRRGHKQVEKLSVEAADHADALIVAVERRMAGAHVSATEATGLGLAAGAGGVLLILAMSLGNTLRLHKAVLRPLEQLAHAAQRFGAGDFSARLGALGKGELCTVATAFDRMAEELAAREQRLIRTERMAAIGQLAAGVAHEMNNPIGIIRGYLKTMQPNAYPQTLREELEILDEEAAACQRIADDLLAYARAPELEIAHVKMREFLDETLRRLQETPDFAGRMVRVDAAPRELWADPARLRQVVVNLLLNAVQVSDPDQAVDVVGRPLDDGSYEISVLDRGPGISSDDRERIFEPFFSRRRRGSGLGLSVCQGIVRYHGGNIAVEERAGGGSIFRVRLPAFPNNPEER